MNEWAKQNLGRYYFPVIVGIAVLFVFGWLYADHHRNDKVNNDTDGTMERIDQRIQGIESRIDKLQTRIDQAEKTVSGTLETIRNGRENAVTVTTGIDRAEERLDAIIQRQGRIENIIADIEARNR